MKRSAVAKQGQILDSLELLLSNNPPDEMATTGWRELWRALFDEKSCSFR